MKNDFKKIKDTFLPDIMTATDATLSKVFKHLIATCEEDGFDVIKEFEVAMSRKRRKIVDYNEDDVNDVYKAYPSKCIVSGRGLGKCSRNKEQIGRLLKNTNKEKLIKTIRLYTEDCAKNKIYMKNFSTFLNNVPEYEEDRNERSLVFWELDGKRQKSGLKDFQDNLQSKGSKRVKFIGYANKRI